jgi:hypothetical protein
MCLPGISLRNPRGRRRAVWGIGSRLRRHERALDRRRHGVGADAVAGGAAGGVGDAEQGRRGNGRRVDACRVRSRVPAHRYSAVLRFRRPAQADAELPRPADGAHTPRARARCPRAIASACSACAAALSMRPTITFVSPRDRATDPVPGSTSAGRATVTFPGTMNAWKDHGGPMHRDRLRLVSLVCLGAFGVSYRRHSSLRVAPASPETPGAPATADQA